RHDHDRQHGDLAGDAGGRGARLFGHGVGHEVGHGVRRGPRSGPGRGARACASFSGAPQRSRRPRGTRLCSGLDHPGRTSPMLSDADRKKAADILVEAERTRKQAVQLSTTWPNIAIEDSYAISTEVANRKVAAGARLIGHKVGLTSKAMQRSSMIDEPDYGHLLDDMMIADGARIPHANFCRPRVEIELAFILGKPLKGPGVTLPDVLR